DTLPPSSSHLSACNPPPVPCLLNFTTTTTTMTQTSSPSSTTTHPSAAIVAGAVLMLPIALSAEPISTASSVLFISALSVHPQCPMLYYHIPRINARPTTICIVSSSTHSHTMHRLASVVIRIVPPSPRYHFVTECNPARADSLL
ncbi:hypothetical protein PISMIDRAFT_671621, partial [Pisolithus microcarpus 441]